MNRLSQVDVGKANRQSIRAMLIGYPGISRVEIAEKLGLSKMAVTRHVTAIRSEWGGKSLPTKRGK